MERLDDGHWVEMPYLNISRAALLERLALYRSENPTETYRLASRTVMTTSWLEVAEDG